MDQDHGCKTLLNFLDFTASHMCPLYTPLCSPHRNDQDISAIEKEQQASCQGLKGEWRGLCIVSLKKGTPRAACGQRKDSQLKAEVPYISTVFPAQSIY